MKKWTKATRPKTGGQTREVLQSEKKNITNSRGSLHADLPAFWAGTGISRLFSC